MSPMRAGAALILALVLLAALLLLGLPFLFSQSASVAGTRSYAGGKLAQVGRDNVENVAIALAAYALTPALQAYAPAASPGPQQWSNLPASFSAANTSTPAMLRAAVVPLPSNDLVNSNDTAGAIGVVPASLNITPLPAAGLQATYLGATIHDEAGKLDPNHMGPVVWDHLLAAVGITDWDDDQVYQTPTGSPPFPPGTYFPDNDSVGQLAQALAALRETLPGRRITSIEQLLQANPQTVGGNWVKLRTPLTRSELERLRPYLTLHNPPPGRQGLVDLGTVVQSDGIHDTQWLDCQPDPRQPNQPGIWNGLGDGGGPLLGSGSIVVGENTVATAVHATGEVTDDPNDTLYPTSVIEEGGGTAHMLLRKSYAGDTLAGVGQGVMLEVPAPLNVHQLPSAVCAAMLGPNQPPQPGAVGYPNFPSPFAPQRSMDDPTTPGTDESIVATVGTTVAGSSGGLSKVMVRTFVNNVPTNSFVNLFPWTYPLLTGSDMPPLGILSSGVFTIEASATVTDRLDRQIAQALRRDVVQALPQEYLQERRWLTQGAMHGLVAGRFGSHVQTWPVAHERQFTDFAGNPVFPADSDFVLNPGATVAQGTSIRPRPLPDVTTIPLTQSSLYYEDLYLRHLAIDWRLTFGGDPYNVLHSADQVFEAESLLSPFPTTSSNTQLESLGVTTQSLDDASLVGLPETEMHPDGFHHATDTRLSYPLAAANNQSAFVIARVNSSVSEMESRQFGLWIQPQIDWTANQKPSIGVLPLCELRMPPCNISHQFVAGANLQGSNVSQNYLGLFYDSNEQMLILATAPPSIEHTHDDAITVPSDDPSTQLVNESSLGSDSGLPLASLAPAQWADAGAGMMTFTGLAAPNRVLHCYYTPADKAGTPYFHKGQWYHLLVTIATDRPDGVSLVVDGNVGQDIYKTEPGAPAFAVFGDHCTLPSLSLTTAIPFTAITSAPTSATAVGGLLPGDIQVSVPSSPAGLTVQSVLPVRGMVHIDDEYFSYDHITGSGPTATLQGCVRARRQDTITNSTTSAYVFPSTQSHRVGATVMPAGYRLALTAPQPPPGQKLVFPYPQLYRGGAVLGQTLGIGDGNAAVATVGAANPAPAWVVWAPIDHRPPDTDTSPLSSGALPLTRLFTSSTEIPINTSLGVFNQFPSRGVVYFRNTYIAYGGKTANSLTNLAVVDASWVTPSSPMFSYLTTFNGQPSIPTAGLDFPTNFKEPVVLVSIYVNGMDPSTAGAYVLNRNTTPGDSLISVLDSATGRVEWLHYWDAVSDKAPGMTVPGGFFVDWNIGGDYGFDFNHRGQGRTAYAARDTGIASLTTTTLFASGSKVEPVQTEMGAAGHWLATGDVVTLMPHQPTPSTAAPAVVPALTPGTQLAMQMVIRFAATDGFPSALPSGGQPGAGSYTDIHNEYFSFSDAIPAAFAPGPVQVPPSPETGGGVVCANIDVLCGNCWGGDDLTPTTSEIPEPRGHLPRLDLWSATLATGTVSPLTSGPRVFFGSTDPDYSTVAAGSFGPTTASATDCVLDGIYAGYVAPLTNPISIASGTDGTDTTSGALTPAAAPGIVRFFQISGGSATIMTELDPGAGALSDVVVQASTPLFPWSLGNMGLVQIDGETFAYQVPNANDQASVAAALATLQSQPGYTGITNPGGSYFARLVARGLLGSSFGSAKHIIPGAADGPVLISTYLPLPAVSLTYTHAPILEALRLPIGPVLQLQDTITPTTGTSPGAWFALRDQTPASGATPTPATLYAPAALISSADGAAIEMMQLIGPNLHRGMTTQQAAADTDNGKYATASWLRGLYNTTTTSSWSGSDPRPVVIGWWPRYASALPSPSTALTNPYLRCRSYSWLGLPAAAFGAYFDATRVASLPAPFTGMALAQVDVDDFEGRFVIEARAEADETAWSGATPSMDWSQQLPVDLTTGSDNASAIFSSSNDVMECFHDASQKALAVDGAEVRISWRYATAANNANPLQDLAEAANSAPQVTAARVRFLAPVRIIATEHSQ